MLVSFFLVPCFSKVRVLLLWVVFFSSACLWHRLVSLPPLSFGIEHGSQQRPQAQ